MREIESKTPKEILALRQFRADRLGSLNFLRNSNATLSVGGLVLSGMAAIITGRPEGAAFAGLAPLLGTVNEIRLRILVRKATNEYRIIRKSLGKMHPRKRESEHKIREKQAGSQGNTGPEEI